MTASSLLSVHRGEQTPAVIDEAHLRRMTLGDRSLEREVLEIFARQTILMLKRMTGVEPVFAANAVHTLKGSARGIGAWRNLRPPASKRARRSTHAWAIDRARFDPI